MKNLKYIEVLEKKFRLVKGAYTQLIEEDKMSSCDAEYSIEKLNEIEKEMIKIKNCNSEMIGEIEMLHMDLDYMMNDLTEYYIK